MTKPLPRYVQAKRTKGRVYLYFRRGDTYRRLPPDPASSAFAAAYARLLAIESVEGAHIAPGSVRALIADFKRSARWQALTRDTRHQYARAFDRLAPIADFPAADIKRRHVRELRDRAGLAPRASDMMVAAIGSLFRHALEDDLIDVNPARGIPKLARPTSYRVWPADKIAAFEKAFHDGLVPRWAMTSYMLARHLATRRASVLTLAWHHYDGARIRYTPAKGGAPVDVRVPAPLKAYLDGAPRDRLLMVTTPSGAAWNGRHFTKSLRRVLDGLGLKGLHLHGLRHTTSSALAELGASEDHIASITGHRSNDSVRVYTRQARRRRMADEAVDLLDGEKNKTRERETLARGGKPVAQNQRQRIDIIGEPGGSRTLDHMIKRRGGSS